METVLLVVHVLVAIALIGIVLIQRSESDGFGLGSGSGMNFMSGRTAANLLTRTTAILATIFIINSLVLSILASNRTDTSLLKAIQEQESTDTTPKKEDASMDKKTTSDTPGNTEVKSDKKAASEKDAKKAPSVPAVPEAN
jgi:preprotein translocase subunit SecG